MNTIELVPVLLGAAFVGVWVDRVDRRTLMLSIDCFRAVLMGAVAWLAATARLSMPVLYAIALLSGASSMVFEVARQAFVPSMVPQGALPETNSKFELTSSITKLAGPALGGAVLQTVSAAAAVGLDSASYLASVVTLAGLSSGRRGARESAGGANRLPLWTSVREGWKFVWGHRALGRAAVSAALSNFFVSMAEAVWMIFVIRQLRVSETIAGTIQSLGHVGGIAGAMAAAWIVSRVDVGPAMLLGSGLVALGWWSTAAAQWRVGSVVLLALGGFLNAFGVAVFNVSQVSLRQKMTPGAMLGRVAAMMRFLAWGAMPLGALAGGVVAAVAGVRATLLVAAGGCTFAAGVLVGLRGYRPYIGSRGEGVWGQR